MKEIRRIKGGVTSPSGFTANAVYAGIKRRSKGVLDLVLIYSECPAIAAGVFTTNKIKAAPVRLSIKNIGSGKARAIIVNSGNANCCNGKNGRKDALAMVNGVGKIMNLNPKNVLAASTGVIGRRLPIQKILRHLPELVGGLSGSGGRIAARGIMTTDTVPKEAALEIKAGGRIVTIGGIAKGVGMIAPNMATMLCFITTDAAVEGSALKSALKYAVESSFNRISIDGDMSTNDTVVILANGKAGNPVISKGSRDFKRFSEALLSLTTILSKKILSDGEGATKLVEIEVKGAANRKDAEKVARQIANSPLVKTMLNGADPNWGRIAGACGAANARINEGLLDISICGYNVFRHGEPLKVNYNRLHRLLQRKDISVSVNLNAGKYSGMHWTCDLSKEYVRINSSYST
ncbi:MAG: bifunctional glutamate N-acetyltransferase/amino-acid acetyltransferase ArgJ [Candidatus Omnitrophica bacterium]|nr:bifunctional glutamate N-acetyltransferase/amino-acid acetyltransferase ArgJ [Candidatus Omnitrophota bacterium]